MLNIFFVKFVRLRIWFKFHILYSVQYYSKMTIVTVGSVNTLSLSGASAGAVAGATVGTGVGLAGRLLNAGPAASLGGALGAGISAGSILGASVTAIKGSYLP